MGTEGLAPGEPVGRTISDGGLWWPWFVLTLREVAWPPLLLISFHLVALCGFDAYILFPALDLPMHFLGGVVCAFCLHRASINASVCGLLGPFHQLTHRLLVLALTCSVTVLWEFAEFSSDHLFGSHTQLGLEDTLHDMLLGTLGGMALLVGIRLAGAPHPQTRP
ncbi:MAG: hypothetical protein K8R23_01725 [Chthoniobacter sp.]|nr:hypothetical protein [Chthoniobacter sp.]